MARRQSHRGGAFQNTVEFDAELDGGDILVRFTRRTTVEHDPSYGSDADGRRGVPKTFIEDEDPDDVTVEFYVDSHNGVDLEGKPVSVADLTAEQQVKVAAIIAAYLEQHEPDFPDDDRDDGPFDTLEERDSEDL